MEIMGTITQGGFTRVALLADAPTTQPAAAPPVPAAPAAPAPASTGRPKAG
jgi:biopolymer transport protein TolR